MTLSFKKTKREVVKIVKSEILENIKILANQNFSASFSAIAKFIIANSKNLDK